MQIPKFLLFCAVALSCALLTNGQSLPKIETQPWNQTVYGGTTVSFSVTASGATSYAWRKVLSFDPYVFQLLSNGGRISGTPTPTLTITNAQLSDGGYYCVRVQNGSGAVTSAVAVLTVVLPPYDLGASSLEWNSGTGGADFVYQESGDPLPYASTAKLFWASGTEPGNILSSTAIFTNNIPAGFSGQGAAVHVPASVFASPPSGATHIVLMLNPDNEIPESNKANNLLSLSLLRLSNLRIRQEPGLGTAGTAKYIAIDYDLAGVAEPMAVRLDIYEDSSKLKPLPAASLTGDVGSSVSGGANRHIVWNAGADWDGHFGQSVYFELVLPTLTAGQPAKVDTRDYEKLAFAMRDQIHRLFQESSQVQALVDDYEELDPSRVEVMPFGLFFTDLANIYQVRVSPDVPRIWQRRYNTANSIYETISAAGDIVDYIEKFIKRDWLGMIPALEELAWSNVKDSSLSLATELAEFAEAALARINFSSSRSSPMNFEDAQREAYRLRLDLWQGRAQLQPIILDFNSTIDLMEAARQRFVSALIAAPLTDLARGQLQAEVAVAVPPKFSIPPPGPKPGSPDEVDVPLDGLPYSLVDLSGSVVLDLDNGPTPRGLGDKYHRWVAYNLDGTLRQVLHAGTEDDPGQPALTLTNLRVADSGQYVGMEKDAAGNIVKTRSYRIVVGSAAGEPPIVVTNGYSAQFRRGSPALIAVDIISPSAVRVDWIKDGALYRENAGSSLLLGEMTEAKAGVYRAIVQNEAGQVTTEGIFVSLANFAFSNYLAWSEQILDPSQRGQHSSPAGDGIPNLIKYAAGLNPLDALPESIRPQLVRSTQTGVLYYRYVIAKGAPGVTVQPERTADLGSLPWQTVAPIKISDDGTLTTWAAPVSPGARSEFYRLNIDLQVP